MEREALISYVIYLIDVLYKPRYETHCIAVKPGSNEAIAVNCERKRMFVLVVLLG